MDKISRLLYNRRKWIELWEHELLNQELIINTLQLKLKMKDDKELLLLKFDVES